jgi:lipoic acid synthetase
LPNNQISIAREPRFRGAHDPGPSGKPSWLKVRLPTDGNFFRVAEILKKSRLHTICQSAKCPNVSECWSARTATFLILGETCTRSCAFCAVNKGKPGRPSVDEPAKVAEAVAALGLDYAVLTSVTRDDLPDGGAAIFAKTIRAVKEKNSGIKVEVLIPDFKGDAKALGFVLEARPDVLNHNLETTESCYPHINRPRENYGRSLAVLRRARELGALTKSGLMLGLGEDEAEVDKSLADLRDAGCELLTIGQYLRPSADHVPVARYYSPREFKNFEHRARALGFADVAAGPLVRSSYQAHRMFASSPQGAFKDRCDI